MAALGFAVFDTAIGWCGIAWGAHGIVGAQLPEGGRQPTLDRLHRRFPDVAESVPPATTQQAIDGVTDLLRGSAVDLSAVELDLEGVPAFHRRVYEVARTIPPGSTLTYGDIAHRLNAPGSARAVGQALGSNPFAPIVPCHRVLAAGGGTGGFSAGGGTATKLRMLTIEGARAEEPALFDL
ncbi:methylated-DNA--[protein]-cysteine S-methyltransferase [Amycolatopsis palatopharyngis]|uniref:methylated-DNA--[protein]-cysteine S-methyltransferase n=1 Tax=Amycolatopsis palatopharyngis TaxID=187982 RepID=UPI000E28A35D|nr:methylated-DNA--[protein]-cysteine S-methyltransferase [Amycolatopsis palatopharyngis]